MSEPDVGQTRDARETLEAVYEYLTVTLSPCDHDCECILHDVETALGKPSSAGAGPDAWKPVTDEEPRTLIIVFIAEREGDRSLVRKAYRKTSGAWATSPGGRSLTYTPKEYLEAKR